MIPDAKNPPDPEVEGSERPSHWPPDELELVVRLARIVAAVLIVTLAVLAARAG